ncbi:G2/mitotic-specific cyclin-A isoform X1 [Bradysia coprophila]|uniref:G2/mitotic-specific cyclin-A isoform X1 n=1 Tax=Bradysia coprophila TaxID=38358 RepID=UPI00187D89F0|nr:G2/mitotic-specific cyclin-A isoform X1 [Bradysia coprophila]
MATFRIHEDVENSNPNKVTLIPSKLNEKRNTFAVLNNVQRGTKTHALKTGVDLPVTKTKVFNDENAAPKDAFVPVDKFKAFTVVSGANKNVSASESNDDSAKMETIQNTSTFRCSSRQPLQELPNDIETPLSISDMISPMSIEKSIIIEEPSKSVSTFRERFFEVEEYQTDILHYLREAESRNRPKFGYMRRQPDINKSMRTILIDWLVEVGEEYKLHGETLCLAVTYIDRFLSLMSVVRAKLQLVGTAAMFIAAKYEEIYPPDVNEFIYITDHTYSRIQVFRMENLLLKVLQFDLSIPTVYTFLNSYTTISKMTDECKFLAMYLCELSLLETDPYLQYMPSRISAAAIALARHNLNLPIWSTNLEEITGYSLDDLKEVIFHLSNTHMASVDLPQQAIQDKYKASKYKEVSTMQPIQMNDGLYIIAVMRMKDEIEKEAHNKHNNDNVRKITSTLHSL